MIYIIVYFLIIYIGSYFLYFNGFKLGREVLVSLTGGLLNKFIEAFMIFGTIVVGALGANYVKATTAISWTTGESTTQLQNILDGIFPKLLSLVVILVCYWLGKKNVTMPKMILGMLIIVILGTYIGIF